MPENTVQIEGIECEALAVSRTGIEHGEMYMARRNGPWKLLTCDLYHPYDPETCEGHFERSRDAGATRDARTYYCGLVWPLENAYPFNDSECFKVVEK